MTNDKKGLRENWLRLSHAKDTPENVADYWLPKVEQAREEERERIVEIVKGVSCFPNTDGGNNRLRAEGARIAYRKILSAITNPKK